VDGQPAAQQAYTLPALEKGSDGSTSVVLNRYDVDIFIIELRWHPE